jgi:hypothetical protein
MSTIPLLDKRSKTLGTWLWHNWKS